MELNDYNMSQKYLYRVIGIYVPPSVQEFIEEFAYEHCGVIDLPSYFSINQGKALEGDPLSEVFEVVFSTINTHFEELYQNADFEAMENTPNENFEILRLSAEGETVYDFREKVESVKIDDRYDSRTIHGAMFAEAINSGLFDEINVVRG